MKKTETEIVQAIWNDPEEHKAFFANPKKYLLELGYEIPDSTKVNAYENTISLRHIILPSEGTQLPEGDDPLLQIAKQAMEDSEFKAKLVENPRTVAQDMGIAIPAGLEIKIIENKPDEMNVIVPFNPAGTELSDADLEAIAGGNNKGAICGATAGGLSIACGIGAVFSLGATAAASATGTGIIGGASGAAAAAG